MGYQIYGASVSPFVRKTLVYCEEKGIEYEHVPVNPFDPPADYREQSPLGRIPSLRDGDRSLADSSVICAYLERRHPEPALFPGDDFAYARALWFEEFADGGLTPKAGGGVFFPLVVAPLMMKQPADDAVRAEAKRIVDEEIVPMWDYLERELGDREFFVEDRLTIGDIAIASIHVNLYHAGVDIDTARCPKLAAFVERMHARPSFRKWIDEETPTWSQRAA